MEANRDYKRDIIATRLGGLGSSDARSVAQTGRTGSMGYQMQMRLGEMLGQCERPQVRTEATELGDEIENRMFEFLRRRYPEAVSNPYFRHGGLSSECGFDVFNHIDFEYADTDGDTLRWFECKATQDGFAVTAKNYADQLAWHCILGNRRAAELGMKFFRLELVHYRTGTGREFSPDRITKGKVERGHVNDSVRDILRGLEVIRRAVADGFEFRPRKVLELGDLPEEMQERWIRMEELKREIDGKTETLDGLKRMLMEYMEGESVQTINGTDCRCSYRSASVSTGLDSARLREEMPDVFARYNTKKTERGASLAVKSLKY